jgi:hypothetical protein
MEVCEQLEISWHEIQGILGEFEQCERKGDDMLQYMI